MNFSGDGLFDHFPVLTTERLTIRRMTLSDAADMFAYSQNPEVARHVLWDAHRTIGETRAYIRYTLRKYRHGEPASLVIVLRSTGKVIGTIGFMWHQRDNAAAEVGYSLSQDYWNCGLMTEALTGLLDYGFRELRLHRIEAQHEVDNPASGAVMRKVGMRREGTLCGRLFNKGKYVDVVLYAILREEFLRTN